MIYYTGLANQTRCTARAKAPSDILELCRKRKYRFIPLPPPNEELPKPVLNAWKLVQAVKFWNKVLRKLNKGDVLIFQYPLYSGRILPKYLGKIRKKGIRLVALIHDLESLRKGIEGAVVINESAVDKFETEIMPKFNAIICHNSKMKEYLVSIGYKPEKVFCLEIFDYLSSSDTVFNTEKSSTPSVAIAGNLLNTKSGYIYHIYDNGNNKGLCTHLFGLSFDESAANENMHYHGSFPAEELPGKLEGDFGLVWDGPSAETCAGNTGEYLKFNNPHKTSLYLSSNLPVVVWSKAAIADFVLKHHVGIAVDSLYELENAINSVSAEEYARMRMNTKELAKKLRSGHYFYAALDSYLKKIGLC